jgi:hypothetical protein
VQRALTDARGGDTADIAKRLGDRRQHLRFDVAGQLWGSIEANEPVVLRNIAHGGALVEATSWVSSAHETHISLGLHGPILNAVVRHVSPAGPAADRFLVGLEFVRLSEIQRIELDDFISGWHDHPLPS